MKEIDELREVLSQTLDWNRARLTCFCQIVLALFRVRSVNLTQLATAFQGKAKLDSHYKRLQRFFRALKFDIGDAFEISLQIFPIKRKVWLIIDRTNWQVGSKNINILTLAMAYEGTAIPLAWFVMNIAGNPYTDDLIKLLEKVIRQLGPSKIAGLIGGREFIGS
ncbi:hypothetical protein NEOC84_000473|uniref:hypothetical protein n=1 Tax=Neochlamydia sp. AcF84 TaxID=2315858 RepID=UPI001408058C|nr:hypothetical protein [Neochlamydia sp. AcF84]NGY94587.1 hypothetical protein [Neochlamydia sp. AcF84]